MIRHYLLIAGRVFLRSKTVTLLNLTGLTIGLATAFLIIVFVLHQTSYDKYNRDLDRIYMVSTHLEGVGWTEITAPIPLATLVREEIPSVEHVARCTRLGAKFTYNNEPIEQRVFSAADPEIFSILTLPIVQGDPSNPMPGRNSIVVSRNVAQSAFGETNPIGKTVSASLLGSSYEFVVSAVMENVPSTSTFSADFVLPVYVADDVFKRFYRSGSANPSESWGLSLMNTYVLLPPGTKSDDVATVLQDATRKFMEPARPVSFGLIPLGDIYFHGADYTNNVLPRGNLNNIYIYSSVAILLLLIACLNFMILSTGQAHVRVKEIGIRTVVGGSKLQLAAQMAVESIILSLVALIFAGAIVYYLLGDVSAALGHQIQLTDLPIIQVSLLFVVVTLLVGLTSSAYVVAYVTAFRPTAILRSEMQFGRKGIYLRRGMIGLQMVIFIGLILAAVMIHKQLRFFHERSPGFDTSGLVVFSSRQSDLGQKFETFKAQLLANPDVLAVSGAQMVPASNSRRMVPVTRQDDPTQKVNVEGLAVDHDFVRTLGLEIVAGRDLSAASRETDILINESAQEQLGFDQAVGASFMGGTIVGVVKDFTVHSLHEAIGPLYMNISLKYMGEVLVRVRKSREAEAIAYVKKESAAFNGGQEMSFRSFEERVDALYVKERDFAEMITYATFLAIFVAALGLFGSSHISMRQRVKEVGIRKILGASVREISLLVSMEFFTLVLVSAALAAPISGYLVGYWLQNFAYRVSIDVWDLTFTILIAVAVTAATIAYQTARTAITNPVESLRYE